MNTTISALGFLAVAAAIGVLEWQSGKQAASNELLVTPAQRAFVREQVLQSGSGSASEANIQQAMDNYLDEEILYREGVKLGLDQDDLIIKRRVVQKMRFLLEDMTPIAPPTTEQLQTWLEQNPQRYQTEQTIRFEHHFFSRGKRGDEAVYLAQAARELLIANSPVVSDPFPLQAQTALIGQQQVAKEIGIPATTTLFELQPGDWSQPVQSALGVHLFKVLERNPGRTMTLEEAGSQLRSDLIAAQRESVNKAGMDALRSTYTIKEVQ